MSGLRNVEARRFMIIRHFFPTEREIVFGTHFVIPCPSVTQVEYYSPSDGNQGGSVVRAFRVGHNRKRNTSPPLVYSKKKQEKECIKSFAVSNEKRDSICSDVLFGPS